jgi:hypothetical protein
MAINPVYWRGGKLGRRSGIHSFFDRLGQSQGGGLRLAADSSLEGVTFEPLVPGEYVMSG